MTQMKNVFMDWLYYAGITLAWVAGLTVFVGIFAALSVYVNPIVAGVYFIVGFSAIIGGVLVWLEGTSR